MSFSNYTNNLLLDSKYLGAENTPPTFHFVINKLHFSSLAFLKFEMRYISAFTDENAEGSSNTWALC